MKYCKGCNQSKALTEFYKHPKGRNGLASRCKVCKEASKKKYYETIREKIIAGASKWQQNNTEKFCKGCNQSKALTEFSKHCRKHDGLASRCKVCRNAQNKKWAQNNREKVRKYKQNNREKANAANRKSRQRPEAKKKRNARARERYRTDPQFKLECNLRSRVGMALKGKAKSARTMELVGCSSPHLMDHLEKQFLPGMTWENYGPVWHVDHMMPFDSFDLSYPEQQRQCCHYTNLQPLWGPENISKGNKIIYDRVWNGCRWINNV